MARFWKQTLIGPRGERAIVDTMIQFVDLWSIHYANLEIKAFDFRRIKIGFAENNSTNVRCIYNSGINTYYNERCPKNGLCNFVVSIDRINKPPYSFGFF